MAKRNDVKLIPKQNNKDEELAKRFAKEMSKQVINDPDGRTSKLKSTTFGTYTRESIENFLSSPSGNEKQLRDASTFLYQTHSRYRNLLQYYANIPKWYYTISPLGFNKQKAEQKKEAYQKQYQKICNIIESMSLVHLMKDVCLAALREGVYYGVIWGGDGSSFILQKLAPENCAIVSVMDGNVFQYAYDMSKVKEEDLDTYYPPQFSDMYKAYIKSGSKYQIVPPNISFCIKGDPTIINYSIPPFSAVMPSLYAIKNVEELTEAATELSNYKMLAGTIPIDDKGVPLIDWPTAMDYYKHISGNVGDRVGVAISPSKLESFDFEQSGTTAQIDNVSRANENFFAAAGTSALLHGATNSTSGVTKLAIKVDESIAFSLMYQCESAINCYLKTIPGGIKFKLNFLPVSIFNENEMVDQYKSAMNFGLGKLQYAACIGIDQTDILGQAFIENEVLDFDNIFEPMKTAATRSADENKAGRPESDDISDEGEKTKDTTSNDNK